MKANRQSQRTLLPYLIFVAFVLLALLTARAAFAGDRCAGLADVLAGLRTNYGELVLWQGFDRMGNRLIITANPDGSGWTALIQTETEKACLLHGGDSRSAGDVAAPAGKEG